MIDIMKRMRSARTAGLLLAGVMITTPAVGSPLLAENFDDVEALAAEGWVLVNNSTEPRGSDWFAGNPDVFEAASGAPASYVAANFASTEAPGGDISNWLLSPELTVGRSPSLTFLTRAEAGSPFPDRLEVRFSANGASTDVGGDAGSVGDFTTLLLTINPELAIGGYPEEWTSYTVGLSGLDRTTSGRFAFRYVISDTSTNGNYIGVDSLAVDVPEPGVLLLVAAAGVGFARRRLWRTRGARRTVVSTLGRWGHLVLVPALVACTAGVASAEQTAKETGAAASSSTAPGAVRPATVAVPGATVILLSPADVAAARRRRPASTGESGTAGAGQRAYRDPVTGQLRGPEHDERLAEAAAARSARRARPAPPREFFAAGGAVGVALPEHLRVYAVARRGPDGRIVVGHGRVDGSDAAAPARPPAPRASKSAGSRVNEEARDDR